jgi:hypothetical protein
MGNYNNNNAVTDDASAIGKLAFLKATELFKSINLTPDIPPELRAKRTIFERQLDQDVGSHTVDELKQEQHHNKLIMAPNPINCKKTLYPRNENHLH